MTYREFKLLLEALELLKTYGLVSKSFADSKELAIIKIRPDFSRRYNAEKR